METNAAEVTRVAHLKIPVIIPGHTEEFLLVWVKPLVNNYLFASLRNNDGDYVQWVIRVDEGTKIIPISNALAFTEQEYTKIKLLKSLNVDSSTEHSIRLGILQARIENVTN